MGSAGRDAEARKDHSDNQNQFDTFFADKANVNMSSYKVDARTNLPIMYLQDNKQALWEKFSESYPNGMRRTSFMKQLQDGPYKYREDLEGFVQNMVIVYLKI